jgi:hypothetical protein
MPLPGHWLARCALPKKSNTPIVLPGFESKWLAVQTNCSSLHMEILKHHMTSTFTAFHQKHWFQIA